VCERERWRGREREGETARGRERERERERERGGERAFGLADKSGITPTLESGP